MMKLTEISDYYLTWMVKSYSKDHNRLFGWEQIKAEFPDVDEDYICDAFSVLSKDGLVTIGWADNVVNLCELNVSAIRDAEEETKLKKLYTILKEIREWI